MDRHAFALQEALHAAANGGEQRLYRRGKLPGLFAQRTRFNAEVANRAIREGLLEVARVEPIGNVTVEWVRITQKGLDHLLASESPAQALGNLRESLMVNQQGLPIWAAQIHARFDDLAESFNAEVEAMRGRLEQLARQVTAALERLEAAKPEPPSVPAVPWAHETLEYLERRKQVGLGERCALSVLFTALKEKHVDMTIREFHTGLKRLHEREVLTLLPGTSSGDAPGPEYALLDGAMVYYYVGRVVKENRGLSGPHVSLSVRAASANEPRP